MADARTFKALGDPTRLAIFEQLLVRKHCTKSLSRKLGFTEPAISQHLKTLYDAGLVEKQRYGRHMHYLPSQEALDALAADVRGMCERSRELDRDPGACQCEFKPGGGA